MIQSRLYRQASVLSGALLFSSVLLASPAYAYLSPEQVFGGAQLSSSASSTAIPIPFGGGQSSSASSAPIPIPFGGGQSSSTNTNYSTIPIPFGGTQSSSVSSSTTSSSVSSNSSVSSSQTSSSSVESSTQSSSQNTSGDGNPYSTTSYIGAGPGPVYVPPMQAQYTPPVYNPPVYSYIPVPLSFNSAVPTSAPVTGASVSPVLHSGAPIITQTGPQETSALVALVLSLLSTVFIVERRLRQLQV